MLTARPASRQRRSKKQLRSLVPPETELWCVPESVVTALASPATGGVRYLEDTFKFLR